MLQRLQLPPLRRFVQSTIHQKATSRLARGDTLRAGRCCNEGCSPLRPRRPWVNYGHIDPFAQLVCQFLRKSGDRDIAHRAGDRAGSASGQPTDVRAEAIACAAARTSSALRDAITTRAPSSTSACAMARPIPRVPPVTSARLPESCKSMSDLLEVLQRRCADRAALELDLPR